MPIQAAAASWSENSGACNCLRNEPSWWGQATKSMPNMLSSRSDEIAMPWGVSRPSFAKLTVPSAPGRKVYRGVSFMRFYCMQLDTVAEHPVRLLSLHREYT